jgi:peptidoglycan/LPS O-acetylase OafA/YrhL
MSNHQRLQTLDVFRGVAATMVLIYHLIPNFYVGQFGVQLFFIVSGFVIYLTIDKSKSPKEFLLKRFVRLYPTYWVCITITTLVLIFLKQNQWIPTVKQFLVNFSMCQELVNVDSIDRVYWSLLPELFFYGLIFVVMLTKQKENYLYWGSIWMLVIILNQLFNIESKFLFIKILNIRHGQLFFSGILFYKLYQGKDTAIHYLLIFSCFILSLFIYCKMYNVFYAIPAVTFAFVLFTLFVKKQLQFLSGIKPLLFLGSISYPLYLLHQRIGVAIMENIPGPLAVKFSIAFAIALILAWLVHTYIEKKSSLLLNFIKR